MLTSPDSLGTDCPARRDAGASLLLNILAQFHVPIREINEVFPTVVLVETEIDLHKRTPLGPLGFLDQVHPGLLGRAVGLAGVALDARADNVFPRCRPATITR